MMLRRLLIFWLLILGTPLWAEPEIGFVPEVVVMPEVAVGDTARAQVLVSNPGNTQLMVSGFSFSKGEGNFSAFPAMFQVNPGERASVDIVFAPRSGGQHTDALVLQTNMKNSPSHLPRPSVAVTARVVSPEIALSDTRLTFASPNVGQTVTQQLIVRNLGADVLRVARVFAKETRFKIDTTTFDVPSSGSKTITISYTPDSSRARTDSLVIECNDADESVLRVFLDAFGAPRDAGRARLSLARVDTSGFLTPGDTLSVDVLLHTHQDSVGGLEVYVGYDPAIFRSARPDSPFVRKGLTRDSLRIVQNTRVDVVPGRRAVYLSALTPERGKRVLDGVVARVDFVVVSMPQEETRIRTLTDLSRLNSQFTTPSGRAFTLPGSGGLKFGNSPPVFLNQPLIQSQEDRVVSLRLASLATDRESPISSLRFSFDDPADLVTVSEIVENGERRVQFRPPQNGWGTYPIRATVADSSGQFAVTSLILQLTQVNDAPGPPQLIAPVNHVDSLGIPVSFVWHAHDVDRGDVLTFNFRLGTDSLSLVTVQSGIQDMVHVVSDLVPGQTYYWQIGAKDKAGLVTRSVFWAFTMAGNLQNGLSDVGDLDGDRLVGFSDFILFASYFGKREGDEGFAPVADLDQNGGVDFGDFIIFAAVFGIHYGLLSG